MICDLDHGSRRSVEARDLAPVLDRIVEIKRKVEFQQAILVGSKEKCAPIQLRTAVVARSDPEEPGEGGADRAGEFGHDNAAAVHGVPRGREGGRGLVE